jgi:hypothetical protein
MKLELIMLSPTANTDVSFKWVGNSTITPSISGESSTSVSLAAGRVQQVDISSLPVTGEAASLEVTSSDGTPIVAEIKAVASGGDDVAYLSPSKALTGSSIVSYNTSGTTVQLTNTGKSSAQVEVAAQGAGTSAKATTKTVTVAAGSTVAVPVSAPAGSSTFSVTVTPLSGASSIYAARVLKSGNELTVQPMETALETVEVPAVDLNLSGTVPQG